MVTTLVYRENKIVAQNPPIESLGVLRTEPGVLLWVDLSEPTPEETQAVLEAAFAIHPLAIEDCVIDTPFPKLEEFDDYLYLVMHAVDYKQTEHFTTTELNFFLGRNFLLTFHKQPLRPVQAVLERYQKNPSTLVRGPDRFTHVILDHMVEAYKPAMDALHEELDCVEKGVLQGISPDELFPLVISLRKKFSALRQIVRPQREIVGTLSDGKLKLIRSVMVPYLRDLTEDLARIEGQANAWAEQLILSFRVYLNRSSHEANEGIRVLTGITALTIPVLIFAGWFGMNFSNMHELEWKHGYAGAAALVLVSTLAMLRFMRKRKWL